MRQKIIPFQANSIVSVFQSINKQAFEEIRTEPKEQILHVNESQYIEHILAKFRLDVPEIFESQKTVASIEQTVEVERVNFGSRLAKRLHDRSAPSTNKCPAE